MKVLHLSAGNLSGGAARGAYWLHLALGELGVNSFFLSDSWRSPTGKDAESILKSPSHKIKHTMRSRLVDLPTKIYRNRKRRIFNTGFDGFDFTGHPFYKEADIIHLHWINGLVSIQSIRKINKPIVWTLRDEWPYTGGCHYSIDCSRYISGCGCCPQLGSNKCFDLSSLVVKNKMVSLPKSMRIVGISKWLSDCARRSAIFGQHNIQTISNNVDTEKFFPVEKKAARKALGLSDGEKVILIGAQAVGDFYKGFDLCVEALKRLDRTDVRVVMFGNSTAEQTRSIPHPITQLGYLQDEVALRLAYSAADVFVAPSRMEAFGKTLVESLSCGTPVACFDATGPADIVEHRATGYKANPFDAADLASGVDWILSQDMKSSANLHHNSRKRAVRLFDSRVIARQYICLYQDILDGHKENFIA